MMTTVSEDNTAWRRERRREMVARRMALSPAHHADLSARIMSHLLATFSPPAVVAFCWPIKAEPDVREKFATFAYEPFILNRQQFNTYIQAESTRFGAIIKKAQVSLD